MVLALIATLCGAAGFGGNRTDKCLISVYGTAVGLHTPPPVSEI